MKAFPHGIHLWTYLGNLTPTLLSELFFKNNELIILINCFKTVDVSPVSMVWSLDSLGWCARSFALSGSPPLQVCLLRLLQHILGPSHPGCLSFPQMPRLFCLLIFAWAVLSLGNALPHVLCLAKSLRWFSSVGPPSSLHPTSLIEIISCSEQETPYLPLIVPQDEQMPDNQEFKRIFSCLFI